MMIQALSTFNITDLYVLLLSIIFISLLFFSGRSITGPNELQAIQIPIGIFLIYIFFIIGSIFKSDFSIINVLFFLIILSAIGIWRSKEILSKDFLILLIAFIFITPLLIFGVLSHNYLWDDYTNWIPPARYLYKNHHLPTLEEPIINHVTSSYSYLRALIHSLINLPINEFNMNIQIVFNILFGSSIFLWATPLAKIINLKDKVSIQNIITLISSFLCFLLVIWIIILYRLLFSSYSEATYLICILHLFFYIIIKIERCNDFRVGKFNLVLSLLLTIPFLIRDTGFYHSIILFLSYLIAFKFPLLIKNKIDDYYNIKVFILNFINLIPLFITKLIWSYYVSANQLSKPFENFIVDNNKLDLIPQILSSAFHQFFNNTALVLSLLIVILFLIFSNKSSNSKIINNNSLFLFVLLFLIGIVLLTLIAYVLVFGHYEAVRAASFSRYIDPATFILWSSLIIATLNLVNNPNYIVIKISSVVITSIYLLIILLNFDRYNFDKNIDNKFIKISSDVVKSFPKNEDLYIIDLQTNGIDAIKIKYYIDEYMPVDYFASVHLEGQLTKKEIERWFKNFENIHIHSASNAQLNIIREYVNELNKNYAE